MPSRKLLLFHIIPFALALLSFGVVKKHVDHYFTAPLQLSLDPHKTVHYFEHFQPGDITSQAYFSIALKQGSPVLLGSSELSSGHLKGLALNYFSQKTGSRFLAMGHAGFQSFAMLGVLAANRSLLKNSKITIILSPGWFEKQYASGTSLPTFFEFCPPGYIYQLTQDPGLDAATQQYINAYIRRQYDKVAAPDAALRYAADRHENPLLNVLYKPFEYLDRQLLRYRSQSDPYLVSQQVITQALSGKESAAYDFRCTPENWDSLYADAKQRFKVISASNDIAVEDHYYNDWLKGKSKKLTEAVPLDQNREYKDFTALVSFLKNNNCRPLFVIMPLNTKAHQDLRPLQPVISAIHSTLDHNQMKCLDLFTPNLEHYEDGVLEDIMHPADYGWYQIDRFISENYCE